jgi:hypothetical protein
MPLTNADDADAADAKAARIAAGGFRPRVASRNGQGYVPETSPF